jgi:hypothetical protein
MKRILLLALMVAALSGTIALADGTPPPPKCNPSPTCDPERETCCGKQFRSQPGS